MKSERQQTFRSSYSGYAVLVIPWLILTLAYVYLSINSSASGTTNAAVLLGTVSLCFTLWLRNFKIKIDKKHFEYRDGFLKTHNIKIEDIRSIKSTSIGWRFLWREILIPRIVIRSKSSDRKILINIKPFSQKCIKAIRELDEK